MLPNKQKEQKHEPVTTGIKICKKYTYNNSNFYYACHIPHTNKAHVRTYRYSNIPKEKGHFFVYSLFIVMNYHTHATIISK